MPASVIIIIIYRVLVKEAMLFDEFLDTLIQRVVKGKEVVTAKQTRPPYSLKKLVQLCLVSLYPPITLEQIILFLTFLFPYLAEPSDKSAYTRKEFKRETEDPSIEAVCDDRGEKYYLLQQDTYAAVLGEVRSFFSTNSNLSRLKKSIYKPEYVEILLPRLTVSSNE